MVIFDFDLGFTQILNFNHLVVGENIFGSLLVFREDEMVDPFKLSIQK